MSNRHLDVTVITPTIPGREHLLEECMESVENQSVRVAKHLIGLDAKRYGPARARNELVEEVETEWIAFLDDDDTLMPNHFDVHKQYMDNEGYVCGDATLDSGLHEEYARDCSVKYDVISSWSILVHSPESHVLFDTAPHVSRIMKGHNSLPVTATVRTSAFRDVGGFDETARFEDMALWQAMLTHGCAFKAIYIPTWYYRIQPKSRNEEE